jgi:methylphosphotriester-DNA--protein-cysteine methyltransferase
MSMRFRLVDARGRVVLREAPGSVGGHRRSRIFGRLDCPAALRALARGGYRQHRVFFADAATALAAGYRPCAVCMREDYRMWKVQARVSVTGTRHSARRIAPGRS